MISKEQFEQLLDNQDRNALRKTIEERYKKSIALNKQQNTLNKVHFRKTIIAAAITLAIVFTLMPLGVMISRRLKPIESKPMEYPSLVQTGSYLSAIIDSTFGLSGGDMPAPEDLMVYNPKAAKSIEITFEGIKYQLEYSGYSEEPNAFDRGWDRYIWLDSDYGKIQKIDIERETGKLRYLTWPCRSYVDYYIYEPATPEEMESCRERAMKIASDYINVEEYAYSEKDRLISAPGEQGERDQLSALVYTFEKRIGELRTNDQLVLLFTRDGEFVSIQLSELGRYDELKEAPKYDAGKVDASIKEVIDETIATYVASGGIRYPERCEYNVEDRFLAATLDGKLCIVSKVDLTSHDLWEENGGVVELDDYHILLTIFTEI